MVSIVQDCNFDDTEGNYSDPGMDMVDQLCPVPFDASVDLATAIEYSRYIEEVLRDNGRQNTELHKLRAIVFGCTSSISGRQTWNCFAQMCGPTLQRVNAVIGRPSKVRKNNNQE